MAIRVLLDHGVPRESPSSHPYISGAREYAVQLTSSRLLSLSSPQTSLAEHPLLLAYPHYRSATTTPILPKMPY
jgi:hypothetical protein